jgi:hypothetical protein
MRSHVEYGVDGEIIGVPTSLELSLVVSESISQMQCICRSFLLPTLITTFSSSPPKISVKVFLVDVAEKMISLT